MSFYFVMSGACRFSVAVGFVLYLASNDVVVYLLWFWLLEIKSSDYICDFEIWLDRLEFCGMRHADFT